MGVVLPFKIRNHEDPVELPDPFGPLTEEAHERFMNLARELDETTDPDKIVRVMLAIQKEVVGWSVT